MQFKGIRRQGLRYIACRQIYGISLYGGVWRTAIDAASASDAIACLYSRSNKIALNFPTETQASIAVFESHERYQSIHRRNLDKLRWARLDTKEYRRSQRAKQQTAQPA